MSEALRVLRHESELGSWELVTGAPDSRLRGLVCDYEGYVERGAATPVLRQQVPTPRIPLIVNFGAPWNVAERERRIAAGARQLHRWPRRALFVRRGGRPGELRPGEPDTARRVHVLRAPDARAREPRRHARGRASSARSRSGGAARGCGRLGGAIRAPRCALRHTLRRGESASDDVAWAWRILERTHGQAPIGWICDRLGRSRRHLAAQFREQIGLPPKTVARIMRFDRAVALLSRPGAQLADVAFECGYYDQAHLNRDFREFAGTSPAAFARQIARTAGSSSRSHSSKTRLATASYPRSTTRGGRNELHRLPELRGCVGSHRLARASARIRALVGARGAGWQGRARGAPLRRRDDHARLGRPERLRLAHSARARTP